MNSIEFEYFTKLHKDRRNAFNVLNTPAFRGVMKTIIGQYSDPAHFIYELLQNADDVGATDVWIELKEDRLLFTHNGNRHFNITNPETEEEDNKQHKLGDINSICSVGQSTKKDETNKIGKFGIGFKAVFQYTKTPLIYDNDIQFRIVDFFVPEIIDDNKQIRTNDNYTFFVLPFNADDKTPEESYEEISDKLSTLVFPSLFLNNIKTIYCSYEDENIIYAKEIREKIEYDDKYGTTAYHMAMSKDDDVEEVIDELWLFERKLDDKLTYAVGFFLDDEGNVRKTSYDAFSYFLTKEKTNLSFLVEAPFQLTASRETIEVNLHNVQMINKLAALAADSLVYLRDIGVSSGHLLITDDFYDEIIPFIESNYEVNSNRLSFHPFYEAIHDKIEKEKLFPTGKSYIGSRDAYWAYEPGIPNIFENDLKIVTNNDNAEWIFRTIGYQHRKTSSGSSGKAFYNYIESILDNPTRQTVELREILTNESFGYILENHDVAWIKELYEFIDEKKKSVESFIKKAKIFLDKNNKATAAFDDNNQEILFLPTGDYDDEYNTISRELLKDKYSEQFIKNFGIKEPSRLSHIYNVVLKKCENGSAINSRDFNYIFNYYEDCSASEREELVAVLRNKEFISCEIDGKIVCKPEIPENVYLPTPELLAYFEGCNGIPFINDSWINDNRRESKIEFFREIGCRETIKFGTRELTEKEAREYGDEYEIDFPIHNNPNSKPVWKSPYIDGLQNCLSRIIEDNDYDRSVLCWNLLVKTIEKGHFFYLPLTGRYTYRPNKTRKTDDYFSFTSKDGNDLFGLKWVFNKRKERIEPANGNADELALDYDLHSEGARILIEYLEMEDSRYADLTEEERKRLERGSEIEKLCEEFGMSMDEVFSAIKLAGHRKTRSVGIFDQGHDEKIDVEDVLDKKTEDQTKTVYKDIEKNRQKIASGELDVDDLTVQDDDQDEDDYIKRAVDYKNEIDKKKKMSALEIERISEDEEWQQKAIEADKYSYEWFKCLLNLEMHARGDSDNLKTTYLRFGKARKEENSEKTIILEQPFSHINPEIEELSDIPLFLDFEGKTESVFVEALSVQSFVVRAKLRSAKELEGIKLDEVVSARLEVKNPVFLLKELRDRYYELGFSEKDNLKSLLPENIEFVFGPPGTGKTTYLAKEVLIPLMKEKGEKSNILVLTPTNKAADVVVNRICSLMEDDSYQEWLIRFGLTYDPEIEKSYLYKDKHVDIKSYKKSITVTTVQRFSYDFFIPGNQENYMVRDVDWDYIVIDEASMISLAYIVYPLYKSHPKKIVIAGDPFQIEPIVYVDMWKDENIYKMVNLNSFSKPKTNPYNYKVKTLTTQYRSIPSIGNIFGTLTYGGVLKHDRTASDKKHIDFGDEFNFASINMIKYPVSKYESIYSSKKLISSSYHIYSALFVYEFVNHISEEISKHNSEEISIGIVSPYRAQADIIKKLLANVETPRNIRIQAGTIHNFQGDECDIMVCVFNTPGNKLKSENLFVNRLNIINVALSRARDYLFVVMPNDETDGINNLTVLNKVKSILSSTKDYMEISSEEIERTIFNSSSYFEDNAFVTGHQSVNIYSEPEMIYEIRSEENAVDIQVHLSNAKGDDIKPVINKTQPKKEGLTRKLLQLKNQMEDEFDPEDFSIKENSDEGKLKVIYLGSALFDVDDSEEGCYVVYTKGRYLNSIYLDKQIKIEYHPSDIIKFRLIVPYDEMESVVESFAEIGEIFKTTDEDAYETLIQLKYNVIKV